MPELPSGTVTFVFTDIEDSTEHLKRLGDGYGEVLSAHRRIVRETFGERGGVEIDTQGDAFFYAFGRARDAVAAAVAAQREHAVARWPADTSIRVRMGLHTGEPAVHEEGYVGLDVVRAARICTLGRGGQILLSETTRGLLGSGVPDGVSVFPLGQRHLRGIDEPERVFEIAIDGLPQDEEVGADLARDAGPPAAPSPSPEKAAGGVGDLGTRLAAEIQERVARALGSAVPAPEGSEQGSGIADIEARLAAMGDEIDARVRAALARSGIADEGS